MRDVETSPFRIILSSTRWFLWVGAFCVIVVICGLCSCYVVAPAFRIWRERQETYDNPDGEDQKSRGFTREVGPGSRSHVRLSGW